MKKLLTLLPFFSSASLFADVAPTGREGNFMQTLIMIGIAIVFFYFILWRPERKRRKAMEDLRSAMKHGDKVTAMGIIGTVDKIQDKFSANKIDGIKI